jgi:Ubiquitin carboxyl-terminal hydrolase
LIHSRPFAAVSHPASSCRTSTGTYRAKKLDQLVSFPLSGLDLSEFHGAAIAEKAEKGTASHSSLYDCVAVVNQSGKMKGGHCAYSLFSHGVRSPARTHSRPLPLFLFADTAVIDRNASVDGPSGAQGEWSLYDDTVVKPCKAEDVVTPQAYIVFFRRRRA